MSRTMHGPVIVYVYIWPGLHKFLMSSDFHFLCSDEEPDEAENTCFIFHSSDCDRINVDAFTDAF